MDNYGITHNITREGMLDLFHTRLCGGSIGFGSIDLDMDRELYLEARKSLKSRGPEDYVCVEDIYREVLSKGHQIIWRDVEDDETFDHEFGLHDLMDNFKNVETHLINDILSEQDDQVTHDSILQCLLLGEIVYG